MISINVRKGQRIEDVLRVFTAKCKKERILEEYKRRMAFEKKSEKRRRESMRRLKKIHKAQDLGKL